MITVGASQPNYLTIDPTTAVIGASFSGHVHAAGLDLDEGTVASPPANNKVRWIRLLGGAVVAEDFSFGSGGGTTDTSRLLRSRAADAVDASSVSIDAADDQGGGITRANLTVKQTGRGTTASVIASAGAFARAAIDQLGRASYVQTVGGQIVQAASRPSQTSRSADIAFSPGGWTTLPFNVNASDADLLFNNNGTGLELKAPSAGWYMFNLSCGFVNNTGGTQETIIGWNSGGIMMRIPALPNTASSWLNATQYFLVSSGTIITPSAFLAGAGFGWTFIGGSTLTVQRVT